MRQRFVKSRGAGLVNTLINKLPFELHIPTYQYCGPGTRLDKRLARGDKGINQLDEACKQHDISYSENQDLEHRHLADKILQTKALERLKARDSSWKEKAAALLVAGVMKGKRTMGLGTKKRKSMIGLGVKKRKIKGRKRRIITPPKIGGFIFSIPLLLGALGALGSLGGGAAAIAKSVNDAKASNQSLDEMKRHNAAMEKLTGGKGVYLPFRKKIKGGGLYLRPYKKGMGLYLYSHSKNSR